MILPLTTTQGGAEESIMSICAELEVAGLPKATFTATKEKKVDVDTTLISMLIDITVITIELRITVMTVQMRLKAQYHS